MRNREHCEMHWSIRLRRITVEDMIKEHERSEAELATLKRISEQTRLALKRWKRMCILHKLRKKLRVP